MSMNIFTVQVMYFTGFEYIFIQNKCMYDEDIVKTNQIHLLRCKIFLLIPFSVFVAMNAVYFCVCLEFSRIYKKCLEFFVCLCACLHKCVCNFIVCKLVY